MNNKMLLAGFTQISLAERIKNKNSNNKKNDRTLKKNPTTKTISGTTGSSIFPVEVMIKAFYFIMNLPNHFQH